MEQESGKHRSEPSFGEDEELGISDNQVDLEKLLGEIDKSAAGSFTASSLPADEPWHDNFTTTDIEADEPDADEQVSGSYSAAPAQPGLDFGVFDDEPVTHPGSAQAAPTPTLESSNGDESMSRGVLMVGGALAALGVLLGAIGMYAGFSASSRIDELQQSVNALQEKLATAQLSGDPRVGQLQAEQAGIVARLDEMVLKLDTLATQPQKGSDPRVAELDKRLDALERKSSTAKATTAAATPAKSTTSTKTSAPATTSKPAAATGDWAVIVLSTAAVTQADSERTRLQKMGYQADVIKTQADGKLTYRVRILSYASHDAAKAAIPAIEKKSGLSGAWVAKR